LLEKKSWATRRVGVVRLMYKELMMIGASILMLVLNSSTNYLSAQDATTNGNITVSTNDTASELGETGSILLNRAGQEVGSTLNQLGQNMSDVGSEIGSEILNETEETAKKVGIGAADVLSNISGEIKEGIGGK
jgi:hypothetical protein